MHPGSHAFVRIFPWNMGVKTRQRFCAMEICKKLVQRGWKLRNCSECHGTIFDATWWICENLLWGSWPWEVLICMYFLFVEHDPFRIPAETFQHPRVEKTPSRRPVMPQCFPTEFKGQSWSFILGTFIGMNSASIKFPLSDGISQKPTKWLGLENPQNILKFSQEVQRPNFYPLVVGNPLHWWS